MGAPVPFDGTLFSVEYQASGSGSTATSPTTAAHSGFRERRLPIRRKLP
jgi:hypothetical protein